MNFQGQELISRATYVSNRSLMALALAKILTASTGLDLDGFTVLGVTPGETSLGQITNYLLVFLAINHLLSWYGDLRSFQLWNHPKTTVSNMSALANRHEPVTELEFYVLQLKDFYRLQEKTREDPEQEPHIAPEQYAAELVATADRLQSSIGSLSTHAKFYLWGWFFALPAAATAYALWL